MQAKLVIALFVITVSGWMAWTANGWRVAADHVKADLAQAQAQLFVTQAALQRTTAG